MVDSGFVRTCDELLVTGYGLLLLRYLLSHSLNKAILLKKNIKQLEDIKDILQVCMFSFGFDYERPNALEIYGKSLSNRNMKRGLHLLSEEKVANFPITFRREIVQAFTSSVIKTK